MNNYIHVTGFTEKKDIYNFTRQTIRTGAAKVQTKLFENEIQQLKIIRYVLYIINHEQKKREKSMDRKTVRFTFSRLIKDHFYNAYLLITRNI